MDNDAKEGLDGFLSKPAPYKAAILQGNPDPLQLARRINRECHRLVFRTDPRNRDGQAMLVVTLFLRALQHYQAAILLLEKGLVASGRVSIRALLESVFAVRAVAASEENFRDYVKSDEWQRLKMMETAQKHPYPVLKKIREAASTEDIAAQHLKVKHIGAKKITTRQLSEQANLLEMYLSAYSLLSTTAHSAVRDFDSYFVQDKEGEIREIEYAPSFDEIPDLLLTAGDFILLGSDAVCRQFEVSDFGTMRHELSAAVEGGVDHAMESKGSSSAR